MHIVNSVPNAIDRLSLANSYVGTWVIFEEFLISARAKMLSTFTTSVVILTVFRSIL